MTNELAKPLNELPNAISSEKYILACCVLNEDVFINECTNLVQSDFYDFEHAKIYKAMTELYDADSKIDLLSVSMKLMQRQEEGQNWPLTLSQLTSSVISSDNVDYHVAVVQEKAVLRKIWEGCAQTMNLIHSHAEFDNIIEKYKTVEELTEFNANQEIDVAFSDLVKKSMEELEQRTINAKNDICNSEIVTDCQDVNRIMVEKGDLMIIAGRPSMGKTAYALWLARNSCKQGKHIAFFSLEMKSTKLADRIITSEAKVSKNSYKRGELEDFQYQLVENSLQDIISFNLHVYEETRNFDAICAKCRKLRKENKLDYVIIDHLRLIRTKKTFQRNDLKMSYFTSRLKDLAKELNIPVLALSQLNRNCESRTPPVPMLSDLKEAGSIEEDADIVIMLYREDYYNEKADPNYQNNKEIELIVGKNREGDTGLIKIKHDGTVSDFYDLNSTDESDFMPRNEEF